MFESRDVTCSAKNGAQTDSEPLERQRSNRCQMGRWATCFRAAGAMLVYTTLARLTEEVTAFGVEGGNPTNSARLAQDTPPRPNPFGIGLVNLWGVASQMDLARGLAGDRGWVLLTLAGVDNATTSAPPDWVAAVQQATQHNLSVVVRLSPPWGAAYFRDEADDLSVTPRTQFSRLAQAHVAVVKGLLTVVPVGGTSLYVQVGNEPNLCYEWACEVSTPSPLSSAIIAAEYAHFFSQTAAAIKALGDPRVKVGAAALAPGGCVQCGCCGSPNCGALDKPGATGVEFMGQMMSVVPTVYEGADFLASHS